MERVLIWFINRFPVCSKVNDYMYLNYIPNRLDCMICFNCSVHCVSFSAKRHLSDLTRLPRLAGWLSWLEPDFLLILEQWTCSEEAYQSRAKMYPASSRILQRPQRNSWVDSPVSEVLVSMRQVVSFLSWYLVVLIFCRRHFLSQLWSLEYMHNAIHLRKTQAKCNF